MAIERVNQYIKRVSFLGQNLSFFKSMSPFPDYPAKDVFYRGYLYSDRSAMKRLYRDLNGKREPGLALEALYCISGRKAMLVALSDANYGPKASVIAMNMYYRNDRDFRDNTIHEGFIGVSALFEGRGIATRMRNLAKNHFARAGLSGISTRISISNHASLRSAEKVGFSPIDSYWDHDMCEHRYYMICRLSPP